MKLIIFTIILLISIRESVADNLDRTFNTRYNISINDFPIAIQSSGKIIGGVYSCNTFNGFVRINDDSTLDSSFQTSKMVTDGQPRALLVLNDDKIIGVGSFTKIHGATRNGLVRLNADGSLDAGFDPGVGPNSFVFSILPDANQCILIGGDFTTYGGQPAIRLSRILADGSLDSSFQLASPPNGRVYALARDNLGRILIGGQFSKMGTISMRRIARLNADGSLDTSFTPPTGAQLSEYVRTILPLPNGNYLVGTHNSLSGNTLVCLNSNGSLNQEFIGNVMGTAVTDLKLDSKGRIVISGWFNTVNGLSRNGLARITQSGVIDGDFMASGEGFWPEGPEAILIDKKGKIVGSGSFAKIHGQTATFIGRLNPYDSTLDTWFNWRVQEFGESYSDVQFASADSDPDFDGRSNLMEFTIGSNPSIKNPPATAFGAMSTGQYFFEYIPPIGFSGSFKIQISDDLNSSTWRDVAVYTNDGSWSTESGYDLSVVTRNGISMNRLLVPAASGRIFMRIKIDL